MLRFNNQGHEHTGNIVYESWSMCEDIFLFKRFILINSDNYLFEVVLGLKKIRQRHREVVTSLMSLRRGRQPGPRMAAQPPQ